MRPAILAVLASLVAAPASAQERVAVHTGDHPGLGRVVFDWSTPPAYQVEQDGERIRLRFPRAAALELPGPRRLPRNVLSIERQDDAIVLRVSPGARFRHFRNGAKVALDILDAVPASTSRREAAPPQEEAPAAISSRRAARAGTRAAASLAAAPAAPPEPVLDAVAPPPPEPAAPPAAAPPAEAKPAVLPQTLDTPLPVQLRPAAEPPPAPRPDPNAIRVIPQNRDAERPELRLVRAGTAGMAVFRRGAHLLAVLDEERALDITRLADHPAWSGAELRRVPGGAVLSWPSAGLVPEFRRDGTDWVLSLRPGAEAMAAPLRLQPEGSRAVIAAPPAAQVVTITDPETGLPLLVGTLREPGLRQGITRAMAEFDLLETFSGVALLARADRVTLRSAPGRFLVSIEAGEVAMTSEPAAHLLNASSMTRSFDLPALPVPQLVERLRSAQAQVAEAAPLTRSGPRLVAAQALLALGLPQEAQAMLRLAGREAPEAAQDPSHRALATMAALLAGRGGEDAPGLDVALPPSDELTLWRAVEAASQGRALVAAPGLAATTALLLAYPEPLRRRLLPIAAEAMAQGDQVLAARRLIEQAGEEPGLRLAQGLLDEAAGDAARALESFDAVAAGRDRRQRARAMRRAAELRLATGRIDARTAALALERTLYAWRGDADELSNRSRVAALRLQAGDPRGAMTLLRETEAAFPEHAAQLRPALGETFLAALRNEPPLSAVALHDSQPDLLPANAAGEEALATLAERLGSLDLAHRAAALLQRAMERMPAGEARAALGTRLATLRLTERDAEGALAALAESSAPGLPPPLALERSLLAARAEARRGRRDLASEALAVLGPAGDETLAEILAEARDFAGAAAALARHLAGVTPAQGPLPEGTQRIALRVAALLAMGGDERGIAALRRSHGPRVDHASYAGAFDALTVDPVRGLADLPRLARELNLFRSLPQMREPLRTAALPAG